MLGLCAMKYHMDDRVEILIRFRAMIGLPREPTDGINLMIPDCTGILDDLFPFFFCSKSQFQLFNLDKGIKFSPPCRMPSWTIYRTGDTTHSAVAGY